MPRPSPSIPQATRTQARLQRTRATYFDLEDCPEAVAFDGNHACRRGVLVCLVPLAHNPRFRLLASRTVSPPPRRVRSVEMDLT
ncbi:hypothetical protein EXIGLDRAFT_232818 [Exidia glandulosa HHB12029]|uniref:Uncharacterized protein n=1 Tax=Exidia glandulosa HHB12029 TaxID=1314781 RepID=A0A165E3U2_EXIGL|nr:hypothetical protein EXIGLDRAFT_232818 [Exidia glandulosa HHB12029]